MHCMSLQCQKPDCIDVFVVIGKLIFYLFLIQTLLSSFRLWRISRTTNGRRERERRLLLQVDGCRHCRGRHRLRRPHCPRRSLPQEKHHIQSHHLGWSQQVGFSTLEQGKIIYNDKVFTRVIPCVKTHFVFSILIFYCDMLTNNLNRL